MIRIILAVFIANSVVVNAQYPRTCVTDESLKNRECCPIGGDETKCGMKSGRGMCRPIAVEPVNNVEEAIDILLDERKMWPTVFYDFACECIGNYDGIACEKCRHGYTGRNCQEKLQIMVRKNVVKMSLKEKTNLIQVIDKSKHTISQNYVILTTSFDQILNGTKPAFQDVSIYDLFAWMHYYSSRDNLRFNDADLAKFSPSGKVPSMGEVVELLKESPALELGPDADYAHEGPAFLPWHRYFLIKWEQEIREYVAMDDSFMVPYWDWTQSIACDVCTNQLMGDQSQNQKDLLSGDSLFSDWEVVCTGGNDYILQGHQCAVEPEGPLLRNPGNFDQSATAGIPTEQEVESTVLFPLYDTPDFDANSDFSFRNIIEGFADPLTGDKTEGFSTMHNAVHLFMNGTMSEVGSSANDPIFILHHAFIDSLYERWLQVQNIDGSVPDEIQNPSDQLLKNGHRHYDYMVPFFPLVRNIEGFALSKDLGYVYEYLNSEPEEGSGAQGESNGDQQISDKEVKTSNEEVVNSNEDVQDSNEEIKSSNVEVQKSDENAKINRNTPRKKQVTRSGRNSVTFRDDHLRFVSQNFHRDPPKTTNANMKKEIIFNLFVSKTSSVCFEEVKPPSSAFGDDIKAFFRRYSFLPLHHKIMIALYFVVISAAVITMFFCLFSSKRKCSEKKGFK